MECICGKHADRSSIELSATCLGHLWLLEDLTEDERTLFRASVVRKKFIKGESLFLEGDTANELFLIKGGRIRLSRIIEDGSEVTLDFRKAGHFVGENVLTEDLFYPCSAWCMEDTVTCGFSKNQFQTLILNHPRIGLRIIQKMSERISWLTTQIGSVSAANIEDRLYQVLVNVAKEHGKLNDQGMTIPFPLTHEDLGFLIGAHRVSVTRAINCLKKSGKICIQGKNLTLPSGII